MTIRARSRAFHSGWGGTMGGFLPSLILLAAGVVLSSCGRKAAGGEDFTRLMNVGKSYYDGGDVEKAIGTFQKAIAVQPSSLDARINLANSYLLANQPETAIQTADQVLQVDPGLAAAVYIRGCANLRLRHYEQAVKDLQQSKDSALKDLQLAREGDKTLNTVSFQLGRAFQEWGRWEDAAREFQEVVDHDPQHPAANYNLSQALVRLGRQAEANQALEQHRQILANKTSGAPPTVATFERCSYTEARVPFVLEQPARAGIKVVFADGTARAFGDSARSFRGPFGVMDFNHAGQSDLFVSEGSSGFRLLNNSNGVFQPLGEHISSTNPGPYSRCLVGDLNNDRFEDVVIVGSNGLQAFRFATNGTAMDATIFSNLKNLQGVDGALADIDFTGKLDLLLVPPGGTNVRVFRNLGNMYFSEISATSGIPASVPGIHQLLLEDWNNDDLLDLIIARENQFPLLLVKERGGALAPTNTPATWPRASVVASGDLNNDLLPDLVAVQADKLVCVLSGGDERLELSLGGVTPREISLIDYDNDGWLDIVVVGEGIQVWRNLGRGGFRETTAELGLNKLAKRSIEFFAAADFDGDCDTDMLIGTRDQGLQLLRNDGGNANHQLKLRLLGNRSNASALGVRIEVTAGNWRTIRTVQQLPVAIGVGQHAQVDSLVVHWADLAYSIADISVAACKEQPIVELMLPQGSCPYLYSWNGKQFEFVTDILGASPLGLHLTDDRVIEADAQELVWLGDDQRFLPKDGNYLLQITEELREVLYLDEARLLVVDHPAGTEVHPTCKLVPAKPWPPKTVKTLGRRHTLKKATSLAGEDVTTHLQDNDHLYVSPQQLRAPQLRGLAEPHGLVLDFGPLVNDSPLVLALSGWLRFGGGMANVAASHDPRLPFPFPKLEAEIENGEWRPVDVVVGAPAGKTKTILVELKDKLPPNARRLRLTTSFEIHWDRIALFEEEEDALTHLKWSPPAKTDLHWRGFSEMQDLPAFRPLTPDYSRTSPYAKWIITPFGWCTRYGEVNELLRDSDNALVVLNGGDELTLQFALADLPEKAAGFSRDYFLYSVGWDKDADVHVERGWMVEPLPWHDLDDQRYGREPRPAFPNDGWIARYNTRWVGPLSRRR